MRCDSSSNVGSTVNDDLWRNFRSDICAATSNYAWLKYRLVLYWFRGRLYINGVQSIIDDAFYVYCEGDEIRRDAINLSCPYAYIKSHDMMSLTLPVFIIYTNLTKKGTSLWYLLLRHSWQLYSSCWASKACGCARARALSHRLRLDGGYGAAVTLDLPGILLSTPAWEDSMLVITVSFTILER